MLESAIESPAQPETQLLTSQLQNRITRMALFYARCSRADKDDLMQEAWLALLEAAREFDPGFGPLKPYLIQRARWRMLDCIKRQHVRKCESLSESNALPQSPAADYSAECEEFCAGLSPLQRNILRCLLAGMTWRETGERLGFSSANVAYHVREIRRKHEIWSGAKFTESLFSVRGSRSDL